MFKQITARPISRKVVGVTVTLIATEHQLSLQVAQSFQSATLEHLGQTNESDLHLLTRLAKEYNAVAKPTEGYLVFVPRGEAKTATGKTIPLANINSHDMTDYRVILADRGKYKTGIAHWHDNTTGERIAYTAGEGKPTYMIRLPATYPTQDTAVSAANAKLDS